MGNTAKSFGGLFRKYERKKHKEPQTSLCKHVARNWKLYSFLVIPIIYYIIFRYIPMLGNVIAFRKYRGGGPIFGVDWAGFRYFKQFLGDATFWSAVGNTLIINLTYLLLKTPLVLMFALLLNEIKNLRWKKIVQTVSYLPHFIAVVVVCGMAKELISINGPINALIQRLGGEAIGFIQLPQWFLTIIVSSHLWQSLGWGTLLYLAAMSGINIELYDAAMADGANRFKQVLHVTIPGILTTIMAVLILDIGGIIGSGAIFERVMMLYNPMTYETADVVSTYVYRMGINSGNYSYATAVGLFEGVISMIMVVSANILSRKLTESSLW